MDLPDQYQSFRDLDRFHLYIDQQFAAHQSALMDGEYERAFQLIKTILDLMKKHVSDEEDLLLPLYKQYIQPLSSGGKSEFYIREHEQLLGYLRVFVQKVSVWADGKPPETLDLVRLFDTYYQFKHLLDHHDTREDTFLYRLLDVKVPLKERQHVLNEFARNPVTEEAEDEEA